MNINELAQQADQVIESCDKEKIKNYVKYVMSLFGSSDFSDSQLTYILYILGNLYSAIASSNSEEANGWRFDDFPENRVKAINCFRSSLELAKKTNNKLLYEISTNLANELAQLRRNIESLEFWVSDVDVGGDAPFVSACSMARELLWLSNWLDDEGHSECYVYIAYSFLKELLAKVTKISHPEIVRYLTRDEDVQILLEYGTKNFKNFRQWNVTFHQDEYCLSERKYRKWCLVNRLFLNSLNDITDKWIADEDILQFPSHIVNLNEGPYMSAAFSALKREYCFARYLAYEGFHNIHPEYENTRMYLTDTLDYVEYGGHIEKVKTSFRVCFSVLDSLSALMNRYYGCGCKSPQFSSLWIKRYLKNEDCHFIDALYWLACDLTDITNISNEKWKAPDPDGMEVRKLRNIIEHGWLRVADEKFDVWDESSDFAHVVSQEELKNDALFVLKVVRSALVYFCLSVNFFERQKNNDTKLILAHNIPVIDDDRWK